MYINTYISVPRRVRSAGAGPPNWACLDGGPDSAPARTWIRRSANIVELGLESGVDANWPDGHVEQMSHASQVPKGIQRRGAPVHVIAIGPALGTVDMPNPADGWYVGAFLAASQDSLLAPASRTGGHAGVRARAGRTRRPLRGMGRERQATDAETLGRLLLVGLRHALVPHVHEERVHAFGGATSGAQRIEHLHH